MTREKCSGVDKCGKSINTTMFIMKICPIVALA
jgi:hypothetical protein